MIKRKTFVQYAIILLFLIGFNLHVTAGQCQTGSGSGIQVKPSQGTSTQVQPSQPSQKKITEKKPIQATPTTKPKPLLASVKNSGCVYPGDTLKLRGSNLGRPGNYSLILQTDGKQVDLTAAAKNNKWSTNQIQLKLPQSIATGLSKKAKATIGFQQHKGRWLTSVDFNLCLKTKTVKPSQTKPQLFKVANKECVRPGDILHLKGKDFGKPGGYKLSMKVGGKTVDLTGAAKRKKWTNDQINVQLPQSLGLGLTDGTTAQIGFFNTKGSWLDNIQFTLCSNEKIKAGPAQEVTYTGLPDLNIHSYGIETAENVPQKFPPNGYSMVEAINYVITVGNIGDASAKKNHVLIEWFDPDGGKCPFSFRYEDKLHACQLKRPINLMPAPSPGFHISNSQQKIIIGPIPVYGLAKEVGWRITLDVENEVAERREDNNVKTFSTRESRTDLWGTLLLKTQPGLDSISIVPEYWLSSGHTDLTLGKEGRESRVLAGPSKVLFECSSLSGYKCPANFPVVVDFGYSETGSIQLCNKLDSDCMNSGVIGLVNAEEPDLFASNTEWLITATVDADNTYPEIDESNNKAYASISWVGNIVKISDGSYTLTNGVTKKAGPEVKAGELPPEIITALVLPEASPVPLTPGDIQPGSTILLKGKRFTLKQPAQKGIVSAKSAGPQASLNKTELEEKGKTKLEQEVHVQPVNPYRSRILLIGDFGARELEDVEWYSDEKAKGVVPIDITWKRHHVAYLRIEREDGTQSPLKDIDFVPALAHMKVDQKLAKKIVNVLECGTDSNFDICNGKVYHSDVPDQNIFYVYVPGARENVGVEYSTPDETVMAMYGAHCNVHAAVGNDVGHDIYRITLKNGWWISKADFKVERIRAEEETKITAHTPPSEALDKNVWEARVDWQVDEGKETIWYGYHIEIVGPKGTLPY